MLSNTTVPIQSIQSLFVTYCSTHLIIYIREKFPLSWKTYVRNLVLNQMMGEREEKSGDLLTYLQIDRHLQYVVRSSKIRCKATLIDSLNFLPIDWDLLLRFNCMNKFLALIAKLISAFWKLFKRKGIKKINFTIDNSIKFTHCENLLTKKSKVTINERKFISVLLKMPILFNIPKFNLWRTTYDKVLNFISVFLQFSYNFIIKQVKFFCAK